MAKKTKKPLKRVKAKGALFDGALPDKIPALDKQCDRLMEAREEKGKANLKEKDIQGKLIEMMHEADIKQYRHERSGKIFKIDAPEKVTFKSAPKAQGGNGINPDSGNEVNLSESNEDPGEEVEEPEQEHATTE